MKSGSGLTSGASVERIQAVVERVLGGIINTGCQLPVSRAVFDPGLWFCLDLDGSGGRLFGLKLPDESFPNKRIL